MNFSQRIAPLIKILPGKVVQLNISSKFPTDIIKLLDQYNNPFDTMLLTNGDVWRYFDSRDLIFNHPKLKHKKVFIHNCGYDNIKFSENKYEIAFPLWYFDRFYWLNKTKSNSFIPLIKNLNYGFSCLNHRASIDRILLGYNLNKKNLLDDMVYSQHTYGNWWQTNSLPINSDIPNDLQSYLDLLPIVHNTEEHLLGKMQKQLPYGGNQLDTIDHPAYIDAYCNIVTESECEEWPYSRNINLPIITEKTNKPFITKQIPLFLAARGHLKYLKGLGFEVMEDLLPSGYDEMPALQKINSIVNLVSKGKEFIQDYYFSHLKEIQHNYELVNSDKVEQVILQRIKDFL